MQQKYAACKTEFGSKNEGNVLRSPGFNAFPSPKRPWTSRSGDAESDMVISETPDAGTEELNWPTHSISVDLFEMLSSLL